MVLIVRCDSGFEEVFLVHLPFTRGLGFCRGDDGLADEVVERDPLGLDMTGEGGGTSRAPQCAMEDAKTEAGAAADCFFQATAKLMALGRLQGGNFFDGGNLPMYEFPVEEQSDLYRLRAESLLLQFRSASFLAPSVTYSLFNCPSFGHLNPDLALDIFPLSYGESLDKPLSEILFLTLAFFV